MRKIILVVAFLAFVVVTGAEACDTPQQDDNGTVVRGCGGTIDMSFGDETYVENINNIKG